MPARPARVAVQQVQEPEQIEHRRSLRGKQGAVDRGKLEKLFLSLA